MIENSPSLLAIRPSAVKEVAATVQLGLLRVTRLLIFVLSTAFVLIIIYAIASRYLFGFSITWIEEIVRFLMAWIVFVGISVVTAERGHMSMDALRQRLPLRTRKLVDVTFDVLLIFFLAVVFYEGLNLAISAIPQTSPVSEISYFWPYLSLPVGAALSAIHLLFFLFDDFAQMMKPNIGRVAGPATSAK